MGGLHYESLAQLPPRMQQQAAGKLMAKAAKAEAVAEEKSTKYHNVKVVVNGIRFASKKEARRYLALMDAVREGAISDLRLQQDFTLQEAYTTPEGERIRAIRYQADFTYKVEWAGESILTGVSWEDMTYWRQMGKGALVIEDTKSRATKTPQYIMKYKMMAQRGYTIREV